MVKKHRFKQANTCKQATSLIADYLTGALAPGTTSELEHHLSVCPDCVAFLKTYKKTIQVTQSLLLSGLLPEMESAKQRAIRNSIGDNGAGR